MIDPSLLCDLCVLPATEVGKVSYNRPDLGLEINDHVQTCTGCGNWMSRRRLRFDVKPMTVRALS